VWLSREIIGLTLITQIYFLATEGTEATENSLRRIDFRNKDFRRIFSHRSHRSYKSHGRNNF
ncbi:MAG: hypothetical protein KBG38_07215, partial [Candidatus Cloacimonas sp.]|nr:hypothetical protein [Candidatus Cloacimonas sp.]